MPRARLNRQSDRAFSGRERPSATNQIVQFWSALELEGAVGDDVLLDLGGAGADRRVPLPHVVPGPQAAVDGTRRTVPIQTGVVGDTLTQVVSGLTVGDEVVVPSNA